MVFIKSLLFFLSGVLLTNRTLAEAPLMLTEKNDSVTYYSNLGDSLLSENFRYKAIDAYESLVVRYLRQDDLERAAFYLDQIGKIYRMLSDYSNAHQYFIQALQLRDDTNSDQRALSHLYLGTIEGSREHHDIAIYHFNRALNLAEEKRDTIRVGQALNNLGLELLQIDKFDSALVSLKEAYFYKTMGNSSMEDVSNTLNNLGLVFEKLEIPDSSYYYYKKALTLRLMLNDRMKLAESYNNLGYNHYTRRRYDSSSWYYQQSKRIADSLKLKDLSIDLNENIFLLLLARNLKDSALAYMEESVKLQTELYNEQSSLQINELRTKYETEKTEKEHQISETKLAFRTLQRNYLFIGFLGILAILIISYFFYRNRQKQLKRLAEKSDQIHKQEINQLLKDQEIRSLNALMEGQEKERKRIAEELHDRLGSKLSAVKLHYDAGRMFKDTSKQMTAIKLLDETIEETRQIAQDLASGVLDKFGLYAALQDLKCTLESSGKIKIDLFAQDLEHQRLSSKVELNLYRIIQELISNCLKHARAKHITIQFTFHESSDLTLMVEDDGIGFDPKNIMKGMGLANMSARASRLEGEIHIDSSPGYGSSITIDIPL